MIHIKSSKERSLWRCVLVQGSRGLFYLTLLVLIVYLVITNILPRIQHSDSSVTSETLEKVLLMDKSMKNRSRTAVMLVTYMRGGSSFLGEVFNQNDDVFYWFEPLPGVFDQFYSRQDWNCRSMFCQFFSHVNGSIKVIPEREVQAFTDPLKAIFTCNMSSVPNEMYRHKFMHIPVWYKKNRKMEDFIQCRNEWWSSTARCLPLLTHSCLQSSIVTTKLIRLRMDLVKKVMDDMPPNIKFKVIHFVRDPRGILVSRGRHSLGNSSRHSPQRNKAIIDANLRFASSLCRTILINMEMEEQLSQQYPHTFLRMRYEYLSTDTKQALKELYDFAELDLPKNVEDRIHALTHAGRSNGAIGTRRKNSAHTALAWKNRMSKHMQESMAEDYHCKTLFSHFKKHESQYL